jgi:hypothetical protein
MRKFLPIMTIIGIVSYYLVFYVLPRPDKARALAPTEYQAPFAQPTWIATSTPMPSATIGYESTLMIAQATADEARRVNAQVTSEAENRIMQYVQMTQVENDHRYQVASWTQIAAGTSIPLTATAQVMQATQIADNMRFVGGILTATNAAPTQYAAMMQLQTQAQFGRANELVKIFALAALGVFLLSIGVFMWRWKPTPPAAEMEMPTETVVHLRKPTGPGTFTQPRYVVPCSPEQLNELAENAANGKKKLSINRLEQTSRTFRNQRAVLIDVREFFVNNQFAIKDDDGTVTLNADGEAFLDGWFDEHTLPTEYQFNGNGGEHTEPDIVPELVQQTVDDPYGWRDLNGHKQQEVA